MALHRNESKIYQVEAELRVWGKRHGMRKKIEMYCLDLVSLAR